MWLSRNTGTAVRPACTKVAVRRAAYTAAGGKDRYAQCTQAVVQLRLKQLAHRIVGTRAQVSENGGDVHLRMATLCMEADIGVHAEQRWMAACVIYVAQRHGWAGGVLKGRG